MSTTKKLSEKLDGGIYFELSVADKSALAAEARALEERVAELEVFCDGNQALVRKQYSDNSELAGRAEQAEKRVAELEAACAKPMKPWKGAFYQAETRISQLTARADDAEAEVAKLKGMMLRDLTQLRSCADERDALRTENERLRAGVDAEEYRAQILAKDFNRARDERDALRVKLERAEKDAADWKHEAMKASGGLAKQSLKLEKVRNVCRRAIVNDRTSQEHDAELAERVDEIQDIVEDEGDDEA